MQKKYRTHKKIAGFITGALMMICFMLIGWFCGMLFDGESLPLFLSKMLGGVFLAYVIYFIHMTWHEFGHLVFGLATGYRFSSFRVLNFMWQKDDDGKIRRYRFHLAGTGGQCILEPPSFRPDGKNPYFLYNAGGVVFNLVLAIIFITCYLLFPNAAPLAKFIFLCFADIGFFAALMNGLPLDGLENDGRNIYMISRSKEAIRAFYMQMRGVALMRKGVRIKDFPEEWFVMPSDEELKNYIITVRALYICDRLFDQEKYQEAAKSIEALLQKDAALADGHRQLLKNNLVFCAALEKDQPKADQWLDAELKKFSKAMQSYPSILRTQYAYELLISNDPEAAGKKLSLFDKAAESYPYPVEIGAEREAIAYAKKIAENS